MIDNYSLFEIHEKKIKPYLEDCQGVAIYDGDPFWKIAGEIYSEQSLEECKHYFERDE